MMKKTTPFIALILFVAGLVVCLPFAVISFGKAHGFWDRSDAPVTTPETDAPDTTGIEFITTEPSGTKAHDVTTPSPDVTTTPDGTTPGSGETETTTQPAPVTTAPEAPKNDFTQVDLSYFDDALFIGDSRTVGLRDYSVGNLKNATFFCREGMSAPRAVRDEFDCTSGVDASGKKTTYGKYTLAELLTEKKFGKIYVMVGINELGYP